MKKSDLILTAVKPPLDYFALIAAAFVAYFIRYLPLVQNVRPIIFDLSFKNYFSLVILIALCWIVVFALAGLYGIGAFKSFKEEFLRIFVGCSAGLAIVLAFMVFSRFLFDSRFIILSSWFLAVLFVGLERYFLVLIKKQGYKYGIGIHRVVLIGDGRIADELMIEFANKPSLGYRVVKKYSAFSQDIKTELADLVDEDGVDEIIQVNPNLRQVETAELIDFVSDRHLDYKYSADLLGMQLTNLDVIVFAGTPIVEVKKTRLDGWGRIYKRIFDILGGIFFIVLFSPVMLSAAIAIKLDSKGPIFFKYKRIGQNGRPFVYFKFRSMIKDAHKFRFDDNFVSLQNNLRDGTPMMKFKDDPRITKVGRFIRRFSIDELPEFFIVVIGKMSLVGPRPHEIEEVSRYQRHHKKVLSIKPGITGLAQVSGRSDLNFEEEVKLDIYYIENWSLSMDINILFKTPLAIFKKRESE